jgi:hypothetical protein
MRSPTCRPTRATRDPLTGSPTRATDEEFRMHDAPQDNASKDATLTAASIDALEATTLAVLRALRAATSATAAPSHDAGATEYASWFPSAGEREYRSWLHTA